MGYPERDGEGEEEGLVLEYSSSWIVVIQDSERLWRDDCVHKGLKDACSRADIFTHFQPPVSTFVHIYPHASIFV